MRHDAKLEHRVLPSLFGHNNIPSFTRQLNVYGFNRLPVGQTRALLASSDSSTPSGTTPASASTGSGSNSSSGATSPALTGATSHIGGSVANVNASSRSLASHATSSTSFVGQSTQQPQQQHVVVSAWRHPNFKRDHPLNLNEILPRLSKARRVRREAKEQRAATSSAPTTLLASGLTQSGDDALDFDDDDVAFEEEEDDDDDDEDEDDEDEDQPGEFIAH
ncbi:hypothetical protein OIO90_001276 [Microbotryomycetes sp. JL221]|nr:hypothetical protein OIO90_001276 [Microbotryomycetes sp. JL221]